MKKKNIYIAGLLLLSLASFSQGKDAKLTKGDGLFEQRAYFKSIEVYEKVANNGYKSVELFEKLGDSYFFNGDYIKAHTWYTKLFEFSKDVAPIYYYRYSQTLKSVNDNTNAELYLAQFSTLNSKDSRSKSYMESKDYLSKIKDKSLQFQIANAGINTEYSDYGTAVYNDRVIFTSSRIPEKHVKKDNWTFENYSSLYAASLGRDNSLSNAEVFAQEIQTQYHESDPIFTKDGKTMYFTRSTVDKSNKKSDRSILLKIYKANLVNQKWDNITPLGFNSNLYNCAHPALSLDEKTLYFVSDMPGGFGDTDIYKLPVVNEMKSSGMVNLGSVVNTSGKETFPWIGTNDELYFASDGHLGLGGLDLFVAKMENLDFGKVVNLGKPVNSQFDDFGFIKLKDSKSGFFTSNREGGKGKDDIYSFIEMALSKLMGLVIDDQTKEIIPGSKVTIYDFNHKLISTINSDDIGRFKIDVPNSVVGTYYIKVDKDLYETKEIVVDSDKDDLTKEIVVALVKARKFIEVSSDLAKLLNIKDIRFDLDKFNIRPDAEVELQKILQVLNEFPNINIAIGSHTDSRQTDRYNIILSEKRAKSTRAYLITKGISGSRITAKGYGETRLLNNCSDGVSCSEEEHQVNRRSEFIVVK
jgi:outer membrane protein OmpA-like peptidoglycan-associated protein/tetratricopeptide (TPR) repeat protein